MDNHLHLLLTLVSISSGIPTCEIKGKSRRADICTARHIFCYLARKEKYTCKEIGIVIEKSHSNIIHSCRLVEDMISINQKNYTDLIEKILLAQKNVKNEVF